MGWGGAGCDKNDHVRLRHSNRAAFPHYFIAAAHASSPFGAAERKRGDCSIDATSHKS